MPKIITIDCEYVRPRFAAAYLLVEGDEAMFIENNTSHAVPLLLKALASEGLRPEQVRYAAITHVHLDHAGGTSALMAACPRATLLAHPRAARHVIDPTRLVASARQVYGDDVFDKLYGTITAVGAERVRSVEDGVEISFGRSKLRFFHVRGHANHHLCIYEPQNGVVFTGDSFGLAYPALQKEGLFVFPSTSPTDFDSAEALASVDRIVGTGASAAYLTHFGKLDAIEAAAGQLRADLRFCEKLLGEARASELAQPKLRDFCEAGLRSYYRARVEKEGLHFGSDEWALLDMDLRINADGLACKAIS